VHRPAPVIAARAPRKNYSLRLNNPPKRLFIANPYML
jgi:hypothetical protein